MSVAEPLIAGEIKRLLRSAGAFDWHGGLREERAPAAKLLHKLPSVGRKVETIVGRDTVLAKRLGKALAAERRVPPNHRTGSLWLANHKRCRKPEYAIITGLRPAPGGVWQLR